MEKNKEIFVKKFSLIFMFVAALTGFSQLATGESDGFLVEIKGMPNIQGGSVVSLGFGSNMKYSFATTEASISVAMPGEKLTIRYMETGETCQNFGDARIEFSDSKAEISGTVGCRSKDSPAGEREDVPIQGWFKLD